MVRVLFFCLVFLLSFIGCNKTKENVSLTQQQWENTVQNLLQEAKDTLPLQKISILKQALSLSRIYPNDSLELKILNRLVKAHYQANQTDSLLHLNQTYLDKGLASKDSVHIARAHFNLGNVYFNKTVYAKAYEHFNTARALYAFQGDSLNVGKSILSLAIIETNTGDYFTSEATSFEALQYFNSPRAAQYRQSTYVNLGIAAVQLTEYPEAFRWFYKAYGTMQRAQDKMVLQNNLGYIRSETQEYTQALAHFDSVLTHPQVSHYPRIYSMALDNKGYTYHLQGDARALDLLMDAYRMRKTHQFSGELNSLWHLGEYYASKNRDSAQQYLETAFALSRKTRNVEMHLKVLRSLSALGQNAAYTTRLIQLKDSIEQHRIDQRYRFARLRYKMEAQEARNQWLEEAFREEKLSAEVQKRKTQFFTSISIALFLLLGAGVILWRYYLRNVHQQIKIAELDAQADERERLAIYLHDEVANEMLVGLQSGNSLLKNTPSKTLAQIIYHFEKSYHMLREIAQKQSKHFAVNYSFEQRLDFLVSELQQQDKIKLTLNGLDKVVWENYSTSFLDTLFYVLREALLNAYKHSKATKIGIDIEARAKENRMIIWDNGIGIDEHTLEGLGMRNMRQKILGINACIGIKRPMEGGTRIQIKF